MNIVTYLFTLAYLSWCYKHKMPFFFFKEMYLANADSGIQRYRLQIGDYKVKKILTKNPKILSKLIRLSQTLFGYEINHQNVVEISPNGKKKSPKKHLHNNNGDCFICCSNKSSVIYFPCLHAGMC